MKWQRRFNITLTIALTTVFILFGVFVFGVAYQRIFEALIRSEEHTSELQSH